MRIKRKITAAVAASLVAVGIAGCSSDADVASRNLSQQADDFQVLRRIVFYNGVTGEYILELKGFCSLGNDDSAGQLSVTCKVGSEYKKHFLGLSDNVTYFAEQIDAKNVSTDTYEVNFKPSTIVPDVEAR